MISRQVAHRVVLVRGRDVAERVGHLSAAVDVVVDVGGDVALAVGES